MCICSGIHSIHHTVTDTFIVIFDIAGSATIDNDSAYILSIVTQLAVVI
jgi:ribosomal protein S11